MTELGHRLNQIELPDSERAMRVAARIIAHEVTAPEPSRLSRWRRWITSLFVGALIGFAFTQPGRAITGEIGEVVGIGDEPTENLERRTAVVIGVGEANSYPYEVVAIGDAENRIHHPGERPVVCIGPEFPDIPGLQAEDCQTDAARRDLELHGLRQIIYGTPAGLYPDAELIIQGEARSDVTSVEIAYRSVDGEVHEGPASIYALDAALAKKIGVSDRTQFFVAFLPPTVLEPPAQPGGPVSLGNAQQALDDIRVTARNADGEIVATHVLGDRARTAEILATFLAPEGRFGGPRTPGAPPER